jgi:hypothetical protein
LGYVHWIHGILNLYNLSEIAGEENPSVVSTHNLKQLPQKSLDGRDTGDSPSKAVNRLLKLTSFLFREFLDLNASAIKYRFL